MMRRNARLAVLAAALLLLGWTIYERVYEVSGVITLGIILLVRSYYRHGTVMMAAKAFHQKDYNAAERLLKEINDPDRLSSKRRGFYEFIFGNIELNRNNYEAAEYHFQVASKFPLRNENDKAIVLVQLANLNLRKRDFEKVQAYVEKAKSLKISARVQSIVEKIEKELKDQK
jgi:outer membrane PBP1 activator LpoA protein